MKSKTIIVFAISIFASMSRGESSTKDRVPENSAIKDNTALKDAANPAGNYSKENVSDSPPPSPSLPNKEGDEGSVTFQYPSKSVEEFLKTLDLYLDKNGTVYFQATGDKMKAFYIHNFLLDIGMSYQQWSKIYLDSACGAKEFQYANRKKVALPPKKDGDLNSVIYSCSGECFGIKDSLTPLMILPKTVCESIWERKINSLEMGL